VLPIICLSWWQRYGQRLVALVFWLLLIGGYSWYMLAYDLSLAAIAQQVVGFLHGPLGPLIYLLVFALRPLVFFSAGLLTIVAGSIFGPVLGILLTTIACNLSAAVAYGLAYWLCDCVTLRPGSAGLIGSYAARLRRNSFETVLLMNMMMLPFDLINYMAGALRINFRAFMLGTLLGSFPPTVAFVLLGAAVPLEPGAELTLPELNPWLLALAVCFLAIGLLVARWLRGCENCGGLRGLLRGKAAD
jgi:uncharacterized membrane protein YdjX (TVP38/TMEM64 family)